MGLLANGKRPRSPRHALRHCHSRLSHNRPAWWFMPRAKFCTGSSMNCCRKASATKGDAVHDTSGLKPFSTALLLNDRQRRAEIIRAGEELKVRFTFLDDAIYPLLSRYFLATPNLRLELVRTELTVARVLTTPRIAGKPGPAVPLLRKPL